MIVACVSCGLIAAFNLQSLYADEEVYQGVWVLFILVGFGVIPFTYATSFFFSSYSSGQFATFIYNLVIGGISPFVVWILTVINEDTLEAAKVIRWVLRPISPTFCFAFGIMNISNREVHKTVFGYDEIKSPFDWELAGADMVFLALHFFVGMTATFLIEYLKTVQSIRSFFDAKDPGEDEYQPDSDVE